MSSAFVLGPRAPAATPPSPRLLDQLRQSALARYGRPEPAERYAKWVRRCIVFHGKRHPRDLGPSSVGQFLEHLASVRR